MSQQDIENLVDFGLTVLQAKAYVALLQLENAHASQISSAIGTVRPETYRVLRELCQKGFVERSTGSPSIFSALPPNHTIPLLLVCFRNRFGELRKKKNALIRSLRTYASEHDKLHERFGSTFTTAHNLHQKHILMIKQVRRDYAAIVSKFGLKRMGGDGTLGEDYVQAIMRARRRGVRIRIISEMDETNLKQAKLISHYVELHHLQDVLFYIHIFDRHEMTIGPASTDEEMKEELTVDQDLWTNNPRFIRGMYAMFERLWEGSLRYSRAN